MTRASDNKSQELTSRDESLEAKALNKTQPEVIDISDNSDRCIWCRRKLPKQMQSGRKRKFCRQSCRQRAYEDRQVRQLLGINESQLVMARSELDRILDLAYTLQGAVFDAEKILEDTDLSKAEVVDVLEKILEACRPLVKDPLI